MRQEVWIYSALLKAGRAIESTSSHLCNPVALHAKYIAYAKLQGGNARDN